MRGRRRAELAADAGGAGATTEPRLDRRLAWLLVAGAASALVLLAVLTIPWDWVPGGELRPAPVEEHFSADEVARAESYSAAVRLLSWSSTALSLAVAGVLGLTRWGAVLMARLARLRPGEAPLPWWLLVPVGVLVLLLLGRLVTTPFALLLHDRRLGEGLTTQPLGEWVVDRLLGLGVSWAVVSVLALLVVGFARRRPRRWFAPAGLAAAGFVFAASYVYPVVVEPLFLDFTPLPEGSFRSAVLDLADAEGLEVNEVLVADASRRTTTLNAYVSGLGQTRRVVLYDTLVADLEEDQALSVIAHELAHAKHHDVLRGTTLAALGALLGLALLALVLDSSWARRRSNAAGPGDPRVVPLLLLLVVVVSLLASPVENAASRAVEARADRTALRVTGDGQAFVEVQERLARRSLADPTPPRWSYWWSASHPTVLQRLGMPEAVGGSLSERRGR